jgi:hypothetical protein
MPRATTRQATDEEYEEWLGRLEEEEPLPDDYDSFVRMLRGELQMADGSRLDYNDTQIDKLWELKGNKADYEEHGISSVVVHYAWGNELRFGVQGLQGLFGWQRVQEIRSEEGW